MPNKIERIIIVLFYMENEEKKTDFELAIMLLQQQFEKNPYSATKDQIDVLNRHQKIEKENRIKFKDTN
jgi:hypothetical protein